MSFRVFAAAVSAAFFVTAASPAFAITSGICFRMANVPANDGLNLRVKPSAKSRIVAHYANSSEVIIAKAGPCRNGWCKVSMHGWHRFEMGLGQRPISQPPKVSMIARVASGFNDNARRSEHRFPVINENTAQPGWLRGAATERLDGGVS